ELLVRSETLITAFLPRLGYERAGALLREFVAGGGRDLRAFLEERLGRETVARTLSAYNLTALGHREDEKDA
ncbi:MAG TPA: aspartate ammonia-lyase, partial [bacterium]|nr:aspartate ammonia-lyase [bacterium]